MTDPSCPPPPRVSPHAPTHPCLPSLTSPLPPPHAPWPVCVQVELFAEGDEVNELYFIVAGYVEVFASASAAEQSDKESL